jgi:phenylpyruvate tautomerase PptA (4-oxalocrotonate tautomerase family)
MMPPWNIYTPVGAFTAGQKKAFAKDITTEYIETVGIPAFYVVVSFRKVPEEDFLVGGEPVGNFIRIFVDHVARQLETPELRNWASEEFEKALVPPVMDGGFAWEGHIDETPIDLWRTQGLVPPPPESDIEKLWAKENRPIPYEFAAS